MSRGVCILSVRTRGRKEYSKVMKNSLVLPSWGAGVSSRGNSTIQGTELRRREGAEHSAYHFQSHLSEPEDLFIYQTRIIFPQF